MENLTLEDWEIVSGALTYYELLHRLGERDDVTVADIRATRMKVLHQLTEGGLKKLGD